MNAPRRRFWLALQLWLWGTGAATGLMGIWAVADALIQGEASIATIPAALRLVVEAALFLALASPVFILVAGMCAIGPAAAAPWLADKVMERVPETRRRASIVLVPTLVTFLILALVPVSAVVLADDYEKHPVAWLLAFGCALALSVSPAWYLFIRRYVLQNR